MSRQQRRAEERKRNKTVLQKICIAAGEGVGRAVAFSFALASNAIAAEPKKEDPITLPPVVVQDQANPYVPPQTSLQRMPVPLQDVPQSITIIPQKLIEEQAGWSLKDALRNVTGIGIAAGEGGGAQGDSFTLRGFSARNDMYLDGVRDQGSYNRDVFNLEAVEVLKGPSSFYFGRGSTGGIINQVSKAPRLDPSYSGTFGMGSGWYVRGTADINQPVTDSIAFRINGMAQRADVVERDDIELMRFGFAPSITFGLDKPTQLTISYLTQYEDNVPDYGHPYIFGEPPKIDRDTFFGFPDSDHERAFVHVGTVRLDHRFNEQFNLRNSLRFSLVNRDAAVTPPRIAGSPVPPSLVGVNVNRNRPNRDTQETILSNQTDLVAKFDTWRFKHTLNTGIEIARETFDSKRWNKNAAGPTPILNPDNHAPLLPPAAPNFKSDVTATSFGIFAADQIKLNEYFEIVGGVRWDYFDADVDDKLPANVDRSQLDKKFSYRGGLIFHPWPDQSIYFSYGTSFNPSAEALSLTGTTNSVKPEENEMFEFGTKLQFFQGALNVQAALFRINKDNARVPNPVDPTLPNVTDGKQRAQGFELGIAGRVFTGLNVFAGYTYLDTEQVKSTDPDNEGKQLQNVPTHSATFWTTYDFLEKFQIGGGPTFVGSRYANADNTNRAPGHVRWDSTIAYSLTPKIQLRLNMLNLTNDHYYENTHPAHVIPGAGRTFIGTASFKF
jgi:catecholate siderophore receptor